MKTLSLKSLRTLAGKTATQPAAATRRWSREWLYFVFVMLAWCFVPLLRRLMDWHNGFFNPIQLTSTIPFLATLPLALFCFRPERRARFSPALKFFGWVWLAVFGYGLLVAAAVGNIMAGLYETIQYLVPMLVGFWLAGSELDDLQIMRRLTRIVLVIGGVVAAYGIVQFVQPPPWDVLWIEGGKYVAMGQPVPFGLRIFSTLNAAGPAADFFALTAIFALPFCRLKNIWIWPFMGLVTCALLLTLVRASWIALAVGVIVYLCMSPSRFRTLPFLVLYGVLLSFLVASLPSILGAQQNGDVISARLSTLTDVGHDDSALARSIEIQDSIRAGLANPIGSGLGQVGSSSALSANPSSASGNVLDSGYLARFLELGWLGFAGYIVVVFGSLIALIASVVRSGSATGADRSERIAMVAAATAICAALVWSDAAGDSHFALDGVFFWLAIGIGLRMAPEAVTSRTRPRAFRGKLERGRA
jgi:hypothetical protein